MTNPQPTVLIIHGAYCRPSLYAPLTTLLTTQGFNVICPELPTTNDTSPPTATLATDASLMRKTLTSLTLTNHPVIILAHSYGGNVLAAALLDDFPVWSPSTTTGVGVAALIYLTAFLLVPGETLYGKTKALAAPYRLDRVSLGDGRFIVANSASTFYNDVPRAEAERLASQNLPFNGAAAGEELPERATPWAVEGVSVYYVLCERDFAIDVTVQEAMAETVGGRMEKVGKRLDVVRVDAGHMPFLSRAGEVAAVVERAWEEARRTG